MQRQTNSHTDKQRREELWGEREAGRDHHKSASTDRSTRFLHEQSRREGVREREREWVHERHWSCLRRCCLSQSVVLSLCPLSQCRQESEQAVRAPALLSTSCSRLNKQTDGVGASVSIGTVRVAHAPSLTLAITVKSLLRSLIKIVNLLTIFTIHKLINKFLSF